ELVERIAREGGGPAALDVERAALHVGGHRDGEEDPGEQEDERGEPEGAARHHAEREEDRGYDARQRDREQRRRAEGVRDRNAGPLGPSPQSLRALPEGLAGATARSAASAHRPPPRASADTIIVRPSSMMIPLRTRVEVR